LTLQQRATSKSVFNGSACAEILELMKLSGINGSYNPLLSLIQQSSH
jgi:hypothetical protein